MRPYDIKMDIMKDLHKYFQPYISINMVVKELSSGILAISNESLYITKCVQINSNKCQDIRNTFQCFVRLRVVGPHLST